MIQMTRTPEHAPRAAEQPARASLLALPAIYEVLAEHALRITEIYDSGGKLALAIQIVIGVSDDGILPPHVRIRNRQAQTGQSKRSNHQELALEKAAKDAREKGAEFYQIIRRAISALDHDRLDMVMTISVGEEGAEFLIAFMGLGTATDFGMSAAASATHFGQVAERLAGVPRPGERHFLLDHSKIIPAVSPAAALRTYAALEACDLFSPGNQDFSSDISVSEIHDVSPLLDALLSPFDPMS